MPSRVVRLVVPIALILITAACTSGPAAPAEDASADEAAAAAMTASAAQASTAAVPSTATNTAVAPATATATTAPVATSPIPRAPLSAVSRGHFWEVLCDKGTVSLAWLDNDNETGYRVYRNGEVIADKPANAINYVDTITTAMGQVAYEIRAYNEFGESEPLRTPKLSCP